MRWIFVLNLLLYYILPFSMSCESNICESSTYAVVPYVEHAILPQFGQKINNISINGQLYTLHQSWDETGVAGVVWDCSIILAQYLQNNSALFANKSVLELGAGTGLPSIVAAKLGAIVTSTDLPKAIPLLTKNIQENLDSDQIRSHVFVESLVWGSSTDDRIFDYIIGADLIYDESVFNDLLQTFESFTDRNSCIYLAVRIRYPRDQRFIAMLRNSFTVEEVLYDTTMDIHVYRCHKR